MHTKIYKLLILVVLIKVLFACNSADDLVDETLISEVESCNEAPLWSPEIEYSTLGISVIHKGVEYTNRWYVDSSEMPPGLDESGAWRRVKECSSSIIRALNPPPVASRTSPAPVLKRHIMVGYIDGTATFAFNQIPETTFAKYDVLIVGFSGCDAANISCKATTDTFLLPIFQKISQNAKPGSKILLSIGGKNGSASFTRHAAKSMPTLANSLIADIEYLNSHIISPTKISGFDINIEAHSSELNITALAESLHKQGYTVSIAPHASAHPQMVNPSHPSNFILTAGGVSNDYAPAIAAGYIDYINLQAYNSPATVIQINGSNETNVNFHQNVAQVMDNLVSNKCGSLNPLTGFYANGNRVCIPPTSKIVIGTVANKSAGTEATMWATELHTIAGNAAVLAGFTASVNVAKEYPNYGGVMVWALGNDYYPYAFGGDTWDPVGAFTNNIVTFRFN